MRSLGLIIKERRLAAGMTLVGLAEHLGMSKSALHRFENGQGWPKNAGDFTEGVTLLLGALGVKGVDYDEIMHLVNRADDPNWLAVDSWDMPQQFAALLDYEVAATTITCVNTLVIPGLAQTREYAEAVFQSGDVPPHEQQDRVTTRLNRQRILDAVHCTLILDEAVLTRPIGTPAVMVDQLAHLATLAKQDNIDVRVLPRARASLTLSGGYVVLEFSNQPPVAYADHAFGGILLDEADRITHLMQRTTKLLSATLSVAESASLIANNLMYLTSEIGE